MSKPLTKKEIEALAMHELMKREQQKFKDRISEQNKISNMTTEGLEKIVYGEQDKNG